MTAKYVLSKRAALDIQQIVMHSMAIFGEIQTDEYMSGLERSLEFIAQYSDSGTCFTHPQSHWEYRRHRYILVQLYNAHIFMGHYKVEGRVYF